MYWTTSSTRRKKTKSHLRLKKRNLRQMYVLAFRYVYAVTYFPQIPADSPLRPQAPLPKKSIPLPPSSPTYRRASPPAKFQRYRASSPADSLPTPRRRRRVPADKTMILDSDEVDVSLHVLPGNTRTNYGTQAFGEYIKYSLYASDLYRTREEGFANS